jgi:hypothetical protein
MRASYLPILLSALAGLGIPSPAAARTVEDEQVWLNGTVTQTTSSGFAWFAEIQPRIGDGASRVQQLLLRPAVGWRLSPEVTVYGGYAHVVLPIENGADRNEERFFGQVSWTVGKIGDGTLSSRSRIEHRRLSNGDDTGWRLREMVRYVHPLGRPETTRALVSVEGFAALNDTDWGARAGLDQVRSFAGVEVPIGGKSTLELGYLNQTINDPARRIRMNHVASLSIFIRP